MVRFEVFLFCVVCLISWIVCNYFVLFSVFFFFLISRTDYFRNFVDSCLQKIPQDRPNSEELLKVKKMLLLYSCDIRSIADSSFWRPSFSTHLSNVKDQNRFWSIWSIGLRMPCGSWTIFSIAKWRRSFFRKLTTAQQLRHKMKRRSVSWLAYASLFFYFFFFHFCHIQMEKDDPTLCYHRAY